MRSNVEKVLNELIDDAKKKNKGCETLIEPIMRECHTEALERMEQLKDEEHDKLRAEHAPRINKMMKQITELKAKLFNNDAEHCEALRADQKQLNRAIDEINELKADCSRFIDTINKLREENEKLKKDVKEARTLAEESLDDLVEKEEAWLDTGYLNGYNKVLVDVEKEIGKHRNPNSKTPMVHDITYIEISEIIQKLKKKAQK